MSHHLCHCQFTRTIPDHPKGVEVKPQNEPQEVGNPPQEVGIMEGPPCLPYPSSPNYPPNTL